METVPFEKIPEVIEAVRDNQFGLLALAMLLIALVIVLFMRGSPLWARIVSILLVTASTVTLAIITLVVNPRTGSAMCNVTFDNTTLLGNSMASRKWKNNSSDANREHCKQECDETAGCTAWVFNKAVQLGNTNCWLYNRISGGQANENGVTGIRLACGLKVKVN